MLKQKNLVHNSTVLASSDIQAFLLSYQFSNFFQQLLYRKNILVTHLNLHLNNLNLNVNLDIFFRKKRLINLRRRTVQKSVTINSIKLDILNFLFKNIKTKFNFNNINLQFRIVNKLLIVPFFFKFLKKKLRYFKKTLFERQLFLYYDFLKITVLYQLGHVTIDTFIVLFGEIFERLHKGKHGKFLQFFRIFFNLIIKRYKYYSFYRKIIGVKFKLSGKIRGKLRAKVTTLKFGAVPINTIEKNIEFSKIDVFTIYGVYGFKLWIYHSSKVSQLSNSIKILQRLKLFKYRKYFFFNKKLYRRTNKYWLYKLTCNKYLKKKDKWIYFSKNINKREKKKINNTKFLLNKQKKFLFLFKNKKKLFFSKSKEVTEQSFHFLKQKKISRNLIYLLQYLKTEKLKNDLLKNKIESMKIQSNNQQLSYSLKLKDKSPFQKKGNNKNF
jgi:small subunit ribosomal protein S3